MASLENEGAARRDHPPARILASPVQSAWRSRLFSQLWKRWELRMRAMRAACEDQRRRKVVKKILPKGESTGRPFAALGAERLSDQSAWLASARWQLAQATEGEDPDDVGACAGVPEHLPALALQRAGG